MMNKTMLSTIAAASLLGCISVAGAQTPRVLTCAYPWCVNQVVVGPNGGILEWDEIQIPKGLDNVTILWQLYGGPDDEFRIDSVVATGTNAAGASTQFPLRQITPTRFALDDLNTSSLPYTYEARVYKKGSPPGTAPIVAKGSVVNAPK